MNLDLTGNLTMLHDQYFDASQQNLEQLTQSAEFLLTQQRGVNWWIGDVARAAERTSPDNWHQVFPIWASPGLIERCMAVAKAYPRQEDRNILATWTQHMQVASKPNRKELVQKMVDDGQTSDESKANPPTEKRWIIAFDCNYFVHKYWHSGMTVESGGAVSSWIERTVDRFKEKGLTDAICCFDDRTNHRKELTQGMEHEYKARRTEKDPGLAEQIELCRKHINAKGILCFSAEGMEADDCMASVATRFNGRVTLVTQDKDMRQCLSNKCNMLTEVNWTDEGPEYTWVTVSSHTESCTYSGADVSGVKPQQWTDFQAICGDNVDNIQGAVGIGAKGAAQLIKEFGTVQRVIQAAREQAPTITLKKCQALLELEERLDVTLKLVTMRTDIDIPTNTRI